MLIEAEQPLLEVKGLKIHFPVKKGVIRDRVVNWVKALDGVELSVGQKVVVGVVGESGSGKSTLAKTILLLEKPTAGDIHFEGQNIHSFDKNQRLAYRRKVQVVFQNPSTSLSPRLKVKNIICEPLEEFEGKVQKEDIAAKALQTVGLEAGFMERMPNELSGGQRQRVAIARAISTHAKLIILDEPTSALDVSVRLQIVTLLKDLQQKFGFSYLLIGHDLALVAYMSTSIAVMYMGKIVEFADTQELLRNTLHPYSKALLSAALPDHPRKKGKRIILSGEIGNPLDLPRGCRFNTRCPQKELVCFETEPVLKNVGKNHLVACHKSGTQ